MRAWMLSALFVAYAAALPAQQTHFGENVDVHLVGIDAIVTDAHGNRVHGLTAADFEILEGSRPQEVTNLSEYRADAARAHRDREPHSLLILIDSLPIQAFVRQTFFRQLEEALPRLMAEGDHVSVVYWEPGLERSREVIDSTDRAKVVSAIRALDASLPAMQLGNVAGEAGLMFLDRKTAAIGRLINALGARAGKKAVLYISNCLDFFGERPNYSTSKLYIDRIPTAANANGVTFYVATPRAGDALPLITEATGGILGFSRSAVAELAPKMEEDLESYYSLAYRARSDGLDHERKVTVKAKNRAYSVRTRGTIVEKSNAAKAGDVVVSRLFGDEGGKDIRFEVLKEPLRRGTRPDQWLLPVVLRIPAEQIQFVPDHDASTAHVGILVASANGVTEVTPITTHDLSVTEKDLENRFITYSFEILGDTRGSKVSIGVVDRSTGAVGVQTIDNRSPSLSSKLDTE